MKDREISGERTKGQAGFTLLEVIIAISILTVGLLAVASMEISAMYGNAVAGKLTEGTTIAQDKLEELLSLTYTMNTVHPDLTDDTTNNGPHYETNIPDGFKEIRWNITNNPPGVGPNTKMITVTVTWPSQGSDKSTSLTSYLAMS
jgi:type IV pilus assembly protein PilV